MVLTKIIICFLIVTTIFHLKQNENLLLNYVFCQCNTNKIKFTLKTKYSENFLGERRDDADTPSEDVF